LILIQASTSKLIDLSILGKLDKQFIKKENIKYYNFNRLRP